MSRKSISNRIRFEIFKRDDFTCQYCGRKPPGAVLQCDHIVPVAGGGETEQENLITSCDICNSGKSDVPLDSFPSPLLAAFDKEKQRLCQLEEYTKLLNYKAAKIREWTILILDEWNRRSGRKDFPQGFQGTVNRLLKRLPYGEIIDAIEIAFDRLPNRTEYQRFKFFCGVCWRKVDKIEGRSDDPTMNKADEIAAEGLPSSNGTPQ